MFSFWKGCSGLLFIGLDPTGYKSTSHQQDAEQALLTVLMTEEERFKVGRILGFFSINTIGQKW